MSERFCLIGSASIGTGRHEHLRWEPVKLKKEEQMPYKKKKVTYLGTLGPAEQKVNAEESDPGIEKGTSQEKQAALEAKKEGVKLKPAPAAKANDFIPGFTQGFTEGFKAGLESNVDLDNVRRLGFAEGRRHIVTVAEDKLCLERKLPGRSALAEAGNLPAWWIATLMEAFE